jgi:DNA polymerase III epsilon subunit-like protein
VKLPPLPLVVLDTETTGFVPRTHRVIEYAAVRAEGGKVTDTYEQLFATDEIPPVVEVITRIRMEDVRGQPTFEEKREEILARIPEDAIIVGQNTPFDLGMLKGEGMDLTGRPWVDTSMLASLVFPELESYSLGYLSAVLDLNHEPKHRALGDVRATLELLSRVWERLLELPPGLVKQAREVMERAPAGYRLLFEALPASGKKETPAWLRHPEEAGFKRRTVTPPSLPTPKKGEIALREEPLNPAELQAIIEAAQEDTSVRHWIAVKNLDAAVRRLSFEKGVRILYPPGHLLDPEAVKRWTKADSLTADEATLLLKIHWYSPFTRNDLPLHGGEESVWRGTLACTDASKAYTDQFQDLPGVVLIDHQQLLRFLQDEEHPAAAALAEPAHIIIDDASMLEDTATKAYGWYADVSALRAGSERNPSLTRITDLLQLWIEKVRGGLDVRALNASDLTAPEAKGLRAQIEELLEQDGDLPSPVRAQWEGITHILNPENLARRYAWIEQRMNGSHTLQSVPEHVSDFLQDFLYSRFSTTLLIPPESTSELREILPVTVVSSPSPEGRGGARGRGYELPLSFPLTPLHEILGNPPEGKTILLIPGKGTIENMYVRYTEMLEERGVTLICLGVSGGQGRMRAEFLAAEGTVMWLVTPWVFEGLELPPETVDHLIISALPFDYASHPVLSRRAARYKSGFMDYFLPRLKHRLFRVLRTFARFKTEEADVQILDDRLRSKEYGKEVIAYLNLFSVQGERHAKLEMHNEIPQPPRTRKTNTAAKKKESSKEQKKDQLKLF